jgi:hypothetical protein
MVVPVVLVAIVALSCVGAWWLNRSPGVRRMSRTIRERDRDVRASEHLGFRYGKPQDDPPDDQP